LQVLANPRPVSSQAETAPIASVGRQVDAAAGDRDTGWPPAEGTHTPPSAPVDLADLTDRVVQAIDRRVLAQRERLGR
jgi:hypothetical protein